jgi:hypothetical protein
MHGHLRSDLTLGFIHKNEICTLISQSCVLFQLFTMQFGLTYDFHLDLLLSRTFSWLLLNNLKFFGIKLLIFDRENVYCLLLLFCRNFTVSTNIYRAVGKISTYFCSLPVNISSGSYCWSVGFLPIYTCCR